VAENKREQKAEAKPSQAEDGGPPSQVAGDGGTAYSIDRLIAESDAFLGIPSHVMAGALHGEKKKHLTLDEARERAEKWSTSPVQTESA